MASFSFLKSTMLCLVLLFSLLFSVQPAQAIVTSVDEETGAAYASGQLIVKYKNWGSKNTSIFTAEGGTVLEELTRSQIVVYEFDDADIAELKETATTLDSNVAYAEPNFVVEGEALPLDSYFSTDQKVMWNGLTRYEPLISANVQEDMGFNHAWDTTKGDTDTIIAVLDSGINTSHQELVGKVVASYNFIDPGTSAADDRGHGTAVASIIAANTNFNSVTTGMAGACPNCKLLNAKVLNSNNMGTTSGVAEAMYWAKDQGADVINMSLGYRSNVLSEAEQDALAYVQSGGNNVTVVAATGNRGENNLFYPAAHPHIIGVGGVYAEGDRGILSNHGNWVDLMAYGYSIRVAWYQTNSAYTFDSGTSFAAPFVSGAAGLLYDRGDLPASNQANYIRKTLIDSARLSSETALSNRVLDAGAAVTDTFTQETQTTRAVRFYVYQDNNNSGELDIGDVCIRETMDLQERTPGSTPYWTILAPVLYTNSSPMVITTGAQLDDCSFGSPSRNLAIGKAHFVYQSSTDGKEITYFTPDYDNSIQYIEIEYEKFGDCNGDGVVTSADITAVGTEIFDGDSSDWMSTQGGTFAGTRFCDANRSGTVEAADISCVGLKIFDPDETCS